MHGAGSGREERGERVTPPDNQAGWFLYLLIPIALAFYFILPQPKPPAAPGAAPFFRSDHVVFGGIDRAGGWIVVPIAMDREGNGTGEVRYEYRGWIGRARAVETLLDERWRARGDSAAYPPRGGLRIGPRDDGGYSLHFDGKGPALRLNTSAARESFREVRPGRGPITTSLAPAWLVVNGDSVRGLVVEEETRFAGADSTGAEHPGKFEWITLWSPEGDAWLLSSSEGRGSFAYHRAPDGALTDARGTEILWTRTGLDSLSKREVPNRWKVSVPAWGLAGTLEKTGAVIEAGPPSASAPPRIRSEIGVTGSLTTGGRTLPVYGMVEHIQEGPTTGGNP